MAIKMEKERYDELKCNNVICQTVSIKSGWTEKYFHMLLNMLVHREQSLPVASIKWANGDLWLSIKNNFNH